MAKMPTYEALGNLPGPQPSGAVVGYQPNTGAETAPGQAMSQMGGQVTAAADHLWTTMKAEQEKTDTIRVEDAWNQYKSKAIDLMHGQDGVLNTQGADAINGNILNRAGATLADTRKKLVDALANDEQKQRFAQRADITDMQTKESVYSHIAREQVTYAKTVFTGSEAAARAQIVANPTDPGTFEGAKQTLMAQAKEYMRVIGVQDQAVQKNLERTLTDGLWVARIDTLLDTNPVLADALLRANRKEISNPETRLLLVNKASQAAISINASIEAQKAIDEVRNEMPPPVQQQPQSRGVEVSVPPVAGTYRNNNPGNIIKSSVQWQGQVEGTDKKFVTFATPEDGFQAMQKNLLTYQDRLGLNTVEAIINRWAPASENGKESTDNYAKTVAKALGVKPGDRIDLHDSATMQKMTAAMAAFEHGTGSPSAPRATQVGDTPQPDPVGPNTSGLPNSRDVAAQLPLILAKVETTADKLYGKDQYNPDRMAFVKRMQGEVQSKLSLEVQQLNSIQRQAQGTLLDAIYGVSQQQAATATAVGNQPAGRMVLTSPAQVMQNPQLAQAYRLLDPQTRVAFDNLMEKNLRASESGDVLLFREIFNRIHLDPSDPNKINFYQQIVTPNIANRLNMTQIQQLRAELDRDETPGGRSINQLRKAADKNVEIYFRNNMAFTAQPDRQIAATMQWNQDAAAKIDEYVKTGKDVRSLFMLDTKDSIVSPAYLNSYVNSTPAQGMAQSAAAVKAGTQQPLAAAPPKAPATIKTEQDMNAWIQTLPAGVTTFTDPNGVVRAIPGRQAQPIATATATPEATKPAEAAMPTMDATGKIVSPEPPQPTAPAPEPEITIDDIKMVEPGNVKDQISALATARRRAAAIRKLGAQGPQYEITGPLVSLGRGAMTAAENALEVPASVGRALAKLKPTEMEAVINGFQAIKKSRRVSMADADILQTVVDYQLLAPADQALARAMLLKIEGKK